MVEEKRVTYICFFKNEKKKGKKEKEKKKIRKKWGRRELNLK